MSRHREPLVIVVEIVCKDAHAVKVQAITNILRAAPTPAPRERAA